MRISGLLVSPAARLGLAAVLFRLPDLAALTADAVLRGVAAITRLYRSTRHRLDR
jgi:hypothetical protein